MNLLALLWLTIRIGTKMKTILSLICLLTALASSSFVFATTKRSEKEDRVYIPSKEIVCSEKGIFIKHGRELLRVKAVAFDENGTYVLKSWVSCKKDGDKDNDKPRGSHDSNKRESTRDDHERADARRQREQNRANERRQQQGRRK